VKTKSKNDLRLDFLQKHKGDTCENAYRDAWNRWSVFIPCEGVPVEREYVGSTLRKAIDTAMKDFKEAK